MPAPADSPMGKDLYDKLAMLADSDDNAAQHGEPLFRFNIILKNGREIQNVRFVDGSNSLDDKSIDVTPVGAELEREITIVIDEIAAFETIMPRDKK